jgi:transcriptional regulator with XRE-family HTH domain
LDTKQRVAESVYLLMRSQHKSNRELAEVVGCGETQASRIVRGRAALNIESLFKVADWLGTTPDQLGRGFELTPILETP